MKHGSLFFFLLCACSALSAMENKITPRCHYSLANQRVNIPINTIKQRLYALHLDDFADETSIYNKIGDRNLSPVEVYTTISKTLFPYLEEIYSHSTNHQYAWDYADYIMSRRELMIKEILKDYPRAIEGLININCLKSTTLLLRPVPQPVPNKIRSWQEVKALKIHKDMPWRKRLDLHWDMFYYYLINTK